MLELGREGVNGMGVDTLKCGRVEATRGRKRDGDVGVRSESKRRLVRRSI